MQSFRYEVLIVDDDPISRKLVNRFLPDNRFVCHEEENVSGVIDFLIENSPHLIFLDLNLPDINGFDFIKESKDLIPEDCLLVIVSSHKDKKYVKKAKELGIDEYIVKPIKPNDVKRITGYFMRNREELTKDFSNEQLEVSVEGFISGLGENNIVLNLPLSFEDDKKVEIYSKFLEDLEISRSTFQVSKIFESKLRTKKSNVFKLIGLTSRTITKIRSMVIRWVKVLD